MRLFNKIGTLIGTLFCLFASIACDSFTEVDLPKNQLLSSNVFEEKGTADAAMVDIYSRIRDVPPFTGAATGISNLLGNYTDELDFYGSATAYQKPFYDNAILSTNPDIASMWNNAYSAIYATNAVLEGVSKAVKLQQEDKDRLTGEALFVRAFIHTYLTGLYGNVPYVSTTSLGTNAKIGKKTTSEVYAFAMADLESAIELLPEAYNGSDRVRPNKYAALALLARVALYAENWEIAANAASAVLNNTTLYANQNDTALTFKKEAASTIWQLAPKAVGGNSLQASAFNFTSGPPPASAMTPALVNAFEQNDLRFTNWVKKVTTGGNSWYQSFKYKQRTNSGTSIELSILLRISELYLIRAEARARQNNTVSAIDDLNTIRFIAGLGATTAVSQQEVLVAVLKERRIELFTEYGHRFFDLKRFGKLDDALNTKPGWQDTDSVWPLPLTEMDLNPNLKPQNPGY